MGQSLIVPAIVVGLGGVLTLFLRSPRHAANAPGATAWEAAKISVPQAGAAPAARLVSDHAGGDIAAEV